MSSDTGVVQLDGEEGLVSDSGELIVVDDETMTLINTDTGEVVGVADSPDESKPAIEIAEWLGERRDWHRGKLAGLQAERQVHLDKIAEVYDSRINRHTRSIAWLELQYASMLLKLAKKLIGNATKRSIAVGTLILKLRTTKPSVDVQDNDKAVGYLKALIEQQDQIISDLTDQRAALALTGEQEDAVYEAVDNDLSAAHLVKTQLESCLNIKTSVYKSSLTPEMKATLTAENAEEVGMVFIPGGEDKLELG
jgi:hypothetical protein